MKKHRWLVSLTLGVGLALALLWLLGSPNHVAVADGGLLYVAPRGECGKPTPCYATVQAAVDAASRGDEIRVAAGTYAGVRVRHGITQTVYVNTTVTIRGGFTSINWTRPNPGVNLTTLDAEGLGRVLVIIGHNRRGHCHHGQRDRCQAGNGGSEPAHGVPPVNLPPTRHHPPRRSATDRSACRDGGHDASRHKTG